jgi:hypothetical protein
VDTGEKTEDKKDKTATLKIEKAEATNKKKACCTLF